MREKMRARHTKKAGRTTWGAETGVSHRFCSGVYPPAGSVRYISTTRLRRMLVLGTVSSSPPGVPALSFRLTRSPITMPRHRRPPIIAPPISLFGLPRTLRGFD